MIVPQLSKIASQFYATTNTPVQIRLWNSNDGNGWHGAYRIDDVSSVVQVTYPTRKRALRACMEHLRDDFVKLDEFAEYMES